MRVPSLASLPLNPPHGCPSRLLQKPPPTTCASLRGVPTVLACPLAAMTLPLQRRQGAYRADTDVARGLHAAR